MCTVSVIPTDGGLRLVSNRDELRSRPRGAVPMIHTLASGAQGLWPIDPVGGGTWIATSQRGLVLTLLNGNPEHPPPLPPDSTRRSRGELIPMLIDAPDARAAINELTKVDLTRFAPLRLVAAHAHGVIDVVWDGADRRIREHPHEPVCFASSGLGDALAADRLPLFAAWFSARKIGPEAQDAFHAHQWPQRQHLSVMMSRADAHTVAVTSVQVETCGPVTMRHRDLLAPEGTPARHELCLIPTATVGPEA